MEMSGERLIAAPKQKVWDALNDPATLQTCIPGCETMEKISATEMNAAGAVKLGPMKMAGGAARYNGKVLLSDLDPPNGYTISCKGEGGEGGHAKVTLLDEAGATRLGYSIVAAFSGGLLGSGLLDSTAKQYVDTFFTRLAASVANPRPVPVLETAGAQLAADGKPPEPILPVLEDVPAAAATVPHDPAAHIAHPAPFHPPAHEDHDHDPSNPHYFGLPIGVIIAGTIAAISVGITLLKFIG